jgi:hypothetical protein
LPDDTSVVKTRRSWHWYFNAPDEPLQCRDLFPGADLKAENVYVVAPPSMHQSRRRYRLIPSPNGKLADSPEWIPEALVERQDEDACNAATVTRDVDGPFILQVIRNRTLFKMACSLRARGAD